MPDTFTIDPKKLDPYSPEYQKAKIDDLVNDAIARKDKKAFEWLKIESSKKENRTRNNITTKVSKNIASIRAEYAKKFLGFKTSSKKASEMARKKKQERAEQERKTFFEEASKLFD